MLQNDYAYALLGGVLIGAASLLASLCTGKIPGISGVFSRVLQWHPADRAWRVTFLLGLLAGAALAFNAGASDYHSVRSLPAIAAAGLLVGLGTRLSGGCTSGHGVCGLALGARDSLVATVVFMATGMATVYLINHLLGGRL